MGILHGINCCPSGESGALILSPPLFILLLTLLMEEVAVALLPCHCWRHFQGNHRAVGIPWTVKILFLLQYFEGKVSAAKGVIRRGEKESRKR